ncbi:MAG: antibiotic biosynthesis monooxygenase [Dehalococcoidia bacterium]
MYARLSLFQLGPGTRAQAQRYLADRHAPIWRRQPGFRSIIFLVDEERGEYGNVSVWDTREHAEAAAEVIRREFEKDVREAGLQVQGAVSSRLFEAYEAAE